MRIASSTLLIALVLAVGACATTSTDGSRNKSGTITLEEIDGAGLVFTNAYEIVRQFRPQWLVKRGTVNINPGGGQLVDYVVIYVDNIRQGDPESLRSITAQAQRLGPRGHSHGAIVVRTKTR